jgi:hypothetical protein
VPALLRVPGITHPVAVYSVHLPARSADEQRSQAHRLASLIAQKGEIAGGDWNSFPRNGGALRDLHGMPPHLRPPRMRTRPGPGGVIELEPNYDVTPGLPEAAEPYIQAETGGSDHHALLLIISRDKASTITPREPAP